MAEITEQQESSELVSNIAMRGDFVMTDYDAIYRRANPRRFPYSPHERQMELSDLWPVDQERFKEIVDATLVQKGRSK